VKAREALRCQLSTAKPVKQQHAPLPAFTLFTGVVMNNSYKRINVALNVAIVLVVILIGVVFAKNYLRPAPASPAHRDFRGMKVNLPGVDWALNEQTLLLVLF